MYFRFNLDAVLIPFTTYTVGWVGGWVGNWRVGVEVGVELGKNLYNYQPSTGVDICYIDEGSNS